MAGFAPNELRELYERYAPVIHRRALAIVGRSPDAWDVVQEVFRRLLESETEFRREARPMTYLYRATTNVALNLLRSRAYREPAESVEPAELGVELAGTTEARNLLQALVRSLDERALRIAALHFLDGLTQEEIAEVMRLSRKTVGKILAQVREQALALQGPVAEVGRG